MFKQKTGQLSNCGLVFRCILVSENLCYGNTFPGAASEMTEASVEIAVHEYSGKKESSDSSLGSAMPRSVMIPVTRRAGVTSNP